MKKRNLQLLLTLIVSMSLCAAFLMTTTTSAHAASARPAASGGGCWTSSDGAISSCISINGSAAIPDAYIHVHNGICATSLYIEIDDYTNGGYVPRNYGSGCFLGHWNGLSMHAVSGHEYVTWTEACYGSGFCEWQRGPSVFD